MTHPLAGSPARKTPNIPTQHRVPSNATLRVFFPSPLLLPQRPPNPPHTTNAAPATTPTTAAAIPATPPRATLKSARAALPDCEAAAVPTLDVRAEVAVDSDDAPELACDAAPEEDAAPERVPEDDAGADVAPEDAAEDETGERNVSVRVCARRTHERSRSWGGGDKGIKGRAGRDSSFGCAHGIPLPVISFVCRRRL